MAETFGTTVCSKIVSSDVDRDEEKTSENNKDPQVLENANEEATLLTLPPVLENIVKLFNKNFTHNDYIIALTLVIMKEVGYNINKANTRGDFFEFDPRQWNIDGVYQIKFKHLKVPELNCKLDAIPVGDVMIFNLTSVDESLKTRSLALETMEFVNLHSSDLSSRFMNLKKFSHKFKDSLTTPIRDEVLNKLGVMNPSLLGLPNELIFKIINLLSAKDKRSLQGCCTQLRNL